MAYVGDKTPATGCVLCAIAAGDEEQSAYVVERTERTFSVLNRFPYNSGHLLVVPLRHAPDILALDDAEGTELFRATQRAMRALTRALAPDGFNLGINHGHGAGAGITDHVHLHVVPRWDGDTNFMPVLADVKVLPEHLEATAAKLRQAYAADAAEASPTG
jgi:ATP adenylyltransferase